MISELLIKELEQEMAITKKMLAIVPADKLDWQPHPKSMSLKKLASHIAEIAAWPKVCIDVEEIDFGIDKWESPEANTGAEFAKIATDLALGSVNALAQADDDTLLGKRWVMKYHGQVIMDFSKYEAIRHSYAQLIHHRAQLGVFLRLLDIPIPGSYGPSADEM